MKFDPPLTEGVLVRRYKRFLADVRTSTGEVITVHCPNTGAMTGCTEPGSAVWYSASDNPKRKYRHTLEVVVTSAGRVAVHSAQANRLVNEALVKDQIPPLTGYTKIVREVVDPNGRGRFDFRLSNDNSQCYVEVKSMTLGFRGGRGAFPDAVSERALKHVRALHELVTQGERAVLLFCVQHTGIRYASLADEVHPEYAQAVRIAAAGGVEILAYRTRINRRELRIDKALPVELAAPEGAYA